MQKSRHKNKHMTLQLNHLSIDLFLRFLFFFETGCLYDNKLFSENHVIPTKEPCLMCSCQQKKISCQLQVISEKCLCEYMLHF